MSVCQISLREKAPYVFLNGIGENQPRGYMYIPFSVPGVFLQCVSQKASVATCMGFCVSDGL